VASDRTRLIPDERVAEVVSILTALPRGLDPLDTVELMTELENEYGKETVRLALRFVEAMSGGDTSGVKSESIKTERDDPGTPLP
jgi:acyl carrier protein